MSFTLTQSLPEQELDDHDLIELTCSGNQSAFETLVHRYQTRLYNFVKSHIGNQDAYDVVQFVWIQLYLSLPRLYSNQLSMSRHLSLKPWLFRVALNRCIDERRKCGRRPVTFSLEYLTAPEEEDNAMFTAIFDPAPQPEALIEQWDQRERLATAIQSLPARFRPVLWMRYVEELTFPEISKRLNIPPTTVKTYFYRACKELRTALSTQSCNE